MLRSRISSILPRLWRGLARPISAPAAQNEPVLSFAPGSEERKSVIQALENLKNHVERIPCVVGGKEYYPEKGTAKQQVAPYDHQRVIAEYLPASPELIQKAIDCALEAKKTWERMPFETRAAIILKIADLASTKYRSELLATAMVGQGKTVYQAEIDATCESIDFLRFAVHYSSELLKVQPLSSPCVWNRMDYRPLEGFIASISPFNFTAIGTNLSATPTLMGNVVVWKPSNTSLLSNWTMFKIYREAGMPDGVINFIPTRGTDFGNVTTSSPHLAAINFTGSNEVFNTVWKLVADNIAKYRTFPRLVGETGGKNYHFVHESADVDNVAICSIRGAFEYAGQKCSATARMYVPESLWPEIRDRMVEIVNEMNVGSPEDFSTFTTAVIDAASFKNIMGYLKIARDSEHTVIVGGNGDDSKGYYIDPTIVQTTNPKSKLMEEEIFGPILTVYVYPDRECDAALKLANETSPYGLTGSVFARDRSFIEKAYNVLRHSAGNFYINDKCTGSVVGQQPFGGARGSGTNDKAGGPSYMLKWVSPVAIKETFVPYTDWSYPSVDKK